MGCCNCGTNCPGCYCKPPPPTLHLLLQNLSCSCLTCSASDTDLNQCDSGLLRLKTSNCGLDYCTGWAWTWSYPTPTPGDCTHGGSALCVGASAVTCVHPYDPVNCGGQAFPCCTGAFGMCPQACPPGNAGYCTGTTATAATVSLTCLNNSISLALQWTAACPGTVVDPAYGVAQIFWSLAPNRPDLGSISCDPLQWVFTKPFVNGTVPCAFSGTPTAVVTL